MLSGEKSHVVICQVLTEATELLPLRWEEVG